jgi:hypothetical protein
VLPVPNDTIWATAITGVVGLGGMLSTGLTALRLERRRVHAEDERLGQQHGNEQRKERGSAYYRAIVLLNRPDRYATGYPPDEDTLTATIDEYNRSVSALHLFGVGPVLDALRDMQRLTREVGEAMATRLPRGDSLVDAFVFAWSDLREDIMEAEGRLVSAMRQDVGPHQGAQPVPD